MEVVVVVDKMDFGGGKKNTKDKEKDGGKEAQGERSCTFVVLEKVFETEDKKKMEEAGGGGAKENLPFNKKEEPLQLSSQLIALINTARLGDVRSLQKMTTAVKNFLAESYQKLQKRRQQVILLLDREDFVPSLLMKCLKANVTKMPQLVADGLWILNAILVTGDGRICKKIDALVDAGLIQLMTKLVGAKDNGLNDLATGALENLISWGYRDQLSAHAFPVFSALTTLLKKKNRSVDIQKMCVHIISAIIGQVRPTVASASKPNGKEAAVTTTAKGSRKDDQQKDVSWRCKELVQNLPALSLVKETIPILNILMNSKDEEVLGKTLSCLAYAGCVEGSFQYIIDCGIMKKVTANITHSDEVVRFFAITAISSIASINETIAINFLKSLKGTFGLKHFYQGLTSKNEALLWAADQFFSNAVNAVTMERPVSDLNNILTSGIIHTFVQCLKPDMHEKHIMGGAWALGRISTEVPLSQRRLIVDAGALPLLVDQLKNENEIISSMAAVAIGNLIQDKPLNRDQIVSLGAIPLLIKLINQDDASIQALISVLAALELIADVQPCASVEVMKDLPQALIAVLDNKSIKFPDKLIPGIYSIIGKLCDSGSAGIDMVLDCGFLKRLAIALNSGNVDTLAFALEAFECISRGTKEQTDKLMEEVCFVENLLELLQHPIRYIRKLAICTLSNLYKGQLTAEKKVIIQKMIPEVLREMSKQDPRENHPAGLAFQNVLSNFHFH